MGKARLRGTLIGALDVGTTKVACQIARVLDDGALQVVGFNQHLSQGLKAGTVVDMDAAEESIRATVEGAEQMAGARVDSVVINVTGGHPESRLIPVETVIGEREVAEADCRRLAQVGRQQAERPERELIHGLPIGWSLDGADGIRDPRGMTGDRLGVQLHFIDAAVGPVRNLATVVRRCHLDVEARVATPYASALACLVPDEMELGVTVIDMGGGTTTIAGFVEGRLIHVDMVPVGGLHVTNDIARGLSTPLTRAERLKTLYGSIMASPADDREMLKVPLVGEEDEDEAQANQVPRSMLTQIVKPRLEETFEMVRAQMDHSGLSRLAGRRVVLTGGASQLQGVREMAADILEKQVRSGRPHAAKGLPESMGGPAFATCGGLLRYAISDITDLEPNDAIRVGEGQTTSRLGRIGQWLRQNF